MSTLFSFDHVKSPFTTFSDRQQSFRNEATSYANSKRSAGLNIKWDFKKVKGLR